MSYVLPGRKACSKALLHSKFIQSPYKILLYIRPLSAIPDHLIFIFIFFAFVITSQGLTEVRNSCQQLPQDFAGTLWETPSPEHLPDMMGYTTNPEARFAADFNLTGVA